MARRRPKEKALNIGTRLEPFVDEALVDTMDGLELKLHAPIPRERAIVFDGPTGGLGCYVTVFQDDDRSRMYYAAGPPHGKYLAYAESRDGKRWVVEESGTLRDGTPTTAVNILKPIDADSFQFQSVKRTLGGKPEADIEPITLRRQQERPSRKRP